MAKQVRVPLYSLSAVEKILPFTAKDRQRWQQVHQQFTRLFKQEPTGWVSVPGRVELGGNHTDHNHGRVLAAAVHLDMLAAFAPTDSSALEVYSRTLDTKLVVADPLDHPVAQENETAAALLRGVAAAFLHRGGTVGGLQAVVDSRVPLGAGLSSSATFALTIAALVNALYNNNRFPADELARMAQEAENQFFGKPCGLMDQMTCALGGVVHLDFKQPRNPRWQRIADPFGEQGWQLAILAVGGGHEDLTEHYAAIPRDMFRVAQALGYPVMREVPLAVFHKHLAELRQRLGDRAVLRAWHFLEENARVGQQVRALQKGDLPTFLQLVTESGNSSFKYLQNVVVSGSQREQPLAVALAVCESWTRQHGGACRVHGGGFAGTILAIIPARQKVGFQRFVRKMLGDVTVIFPEVRTPGAVVFRGAYLP